MGDFLVRRGFREGFGVVPVSVPSSGSGVDPGLRSDSETEALREIFFLGVFFTAAGFRERRVLLEGVLAGPDSGSTAVAGRFFDGVDGERGSGGGMYKPWDSSLPVICEWSSACACDPVGGWTSVEREGMEIALGAGVGEGARVDVGRGPMLRGVAGLLEDPTVMGVDALVETMFGMAR